MMNAVLFVTNVIFLNYLYINVYFDLCIYLFISPIDAP